MRNLRSNPAHLLLGRPAVAEPNSTEREVCARNNGGIPPAGSRESFCLSEGSAVVLSIPHAKNERKNGADLGGAFSNEFCYGLRAPETGLFA